MKADGRPGKAQIRREFLEARLALGAEATERGAAAQRSLLSHPAFRGAASLMVYLSFRGEVPCSLVIETALAEGKVVTAPVTVPRERRLVPHRLTGDPGELRPGAYGILEPDPAGCRPFPPGEIDLVVVPGVAFDDRGGRLGYGGGYYDRFLRLDAPQATRAALAFDVQVAGESLPLDAYDARVDFVFTETRIIRGKREG